MSTVPSRLWRIHLWSAVTVAASAALAFSQPLLGTGIAVVALACIATAVVLSLVAGPARLSTTAASVVCWLLSGVLSVVVFAGLSALLGRSMGQPEPFRLHPLAWACAGAATAVYIAVTLLVDVRRRTSAAPSTPRTAVEER